MMHLQKRNEKMNREKVGMGVGVVLLVILLVGGLLISKTNEKPKARFPRAGWVKVMH